MSQWGEEAWSLPHGVRRVKDERVLVWQGEGGIDPHPMPLPTQEVPTLRQLWARGQQVIMSYEDEATVSRYDQLWPAIPYWWGNAVKTDVLLRFLETKKGQGRPGDITEEAG